jgi:hypothetical protein
VGSTATDQTSRKRPPSPRFLRTTLTGPAGSGKRTDSWKARGRSLASAVVSHSPKMLANPREYSRRSDFDSRTS